jgi:hypothetical protein
MKIVHEVGSAVEEHSFSHVVFVVYERLSTAVATARPIGRSA